MFLMGVVKKKTMIIWNHIKHVFWEINHGFILMLYKQDTQFSQTLLIIQLELLASKLMSFVGFILCNNVQILYQITERSCVFFF